MWWLNSSSYSQVVAASRRFTLKDLGWVWHNKLSAFQRKKLMPRIKVLINQPLNVLASQCNAYWEPAVISIFGLTFSGPRAAKCFVQFVCMCIFMSGLFLSFQFRNSTVLINAIVTNRDFNPVSLLLELLFQIHLHKQSVICFFPLRFQLCYSGFVL